MKKKQRQWVVSKLVEFAKERKVDTSSLNHSTVKNKLENIRKKVLEKHLFPLLWQVSADMPTGSSIDDDNNAVVHPVDPVESLDWVTLNKTAKWDNLEVYFNFFGRHPTWGMYQAKETASDHADVEPQDASSPVADPTTPQDSLSITARKKPERPFIPLSEDDDEKEEEEDEDEFLDEDCAGKQYQRMAVWKHKSPSLLNEAPTKKRRESLGQVDNSTLKGTTMTSKQSRVAATQHAFLEGLSKLQTSNMTVRKGLR